MFEYIEIMTDGNRKVTQMVLGGDKAKESIGKFLFPEVANRLGSERWEMVGFAHDSGVFVYVFKRLIEE